MEDQQKVEVLLKYYEAARTNIITRLTARDNSLLLYLGAVAVLAAAAFDKENDAMEILLFIPLISAGIAAFTLQHNYVMDSLYDYIRKDIFPQLNLLDYNYIPWEISDSYTKGRGFSSNIRIYGELIIILSPAILSVAIFGFKKSDELVTFPSVLTWIFFVISTGFLTLSIGLGWKSMQNSKKHRQAVQRFKGNEKRN